MTRFAVRNLGGAFRPGGSRYMRREVQRASLADVIDTGSDILLLQEVTGAGSPFEAPPGWVFSQPFSKASRGAASFVLAREGTAVDVSWRPEHRVLGSFGAYLDFALWRPGNGDDEVALVSVHVPTSWQAAHWEATGAAAPAPTTGRPWPSDAVLDALIEVLDGRSAIVAGDWNEDEDYPSPADPGAAAFFRRASDAGLVDATALVFKGKVRTNFTRQARRVYQNDRVFLTRDIAEKLQSVAVWNEPGARLSDHAGLTFTIAYGSPPTRG